MATPVEVATKMLQHMEVKPAGILGSNSEKAAEIWKPFEDDNSHLKDLAELIPTLYPLTVTQWLTIVRGAFKANPKISDSNKLRIILRRAASDGYENICNKCGMLLKQIEKYGDEHAAMVEFWEWAERTCPSTWDARVKQFEHYLRIHKIVESMSPLDALDYALYGSELEWEDVEHNEKVRNMIVYVLRRDITYLSIEELLDRNVRTWRRFLIEEWTKHAKPEYHSVLGELRFWEELPKQKNQERRRRR